MSLLQKRSVGVPSLVRALDDFDTFLSRRTGTDPMAYSPRFDMRETKEGYELDGELPGVDKKNVNIEFSDQNTLNVNGHTEHETSSEEPGHSWWYSERSVGNFRRSFSFPTPVDHDHVEASMNNGVLSIHVPKAQTSAVGKHIDIK